MIHAKVISDRPTSGPREPTAQLREARSIEEFRRDVSELLPEATASVALASMDESSTSTSRYESDLRRWLWWAAVHRRRGARDVTGGGVGINLAVQDAVAAAPSWPNRCVSIESAAATWQRYGVVAHFPAVTQAVQQVLPKAARPAAAGPGPTPPAALWPGSNGCHGSQRCPPPTLWGLESGLSMLRPSHVAGPATASPLEPTRAAANRRLGYNPDSVVGAHQTSQQERRGGQHVMWWRDHGHSCYAVHMAHTFGGATPEVVSAQAQCAIQRSIGP